MRRMTKAPAGCHTTGHGARALALLLGAATATLGGCALAPSGSRNDEAAIRAVLQQQVAAWNVGDLGGFMRGYLQARELRIASGGTVVQGWDAALQRYQARYADAGSMGRLAFSEVEVEALGPHHALAFGRWYLQLPAQQDVHTGLFTLVLARTIDGWKIARDHTSAAPSQLPQPAPHPPAGRQQGDAAPAVPAAAPASAGSVGSG